MNSWTAIKINKLLNNNFKIYVLADVMPLNNININNTITMLI